MQSPDDFLNSSRLCALLSVSSMSLYRWERSNIGFPPPVRINGRKYWRRQEIVEFMMSKKKDGK